MHTLDGRIIKEIFQRINFKPFMEDFLMLMPIFPSFHSSLERILEARMKRRENGVPLSKPSRGGEESKGVAID